ARSSRALGRAHDGLRGGAVLRSGSHRSPRLAPAAARSSQKVVIARVRGGRVIAAVLACLAGAASAEERLGEVEVVARPEEPAASTEQIPARELEMRPHSTPFEILNDLPGVVVAQHQGGGKAPQYLVRGFDADHGADFAVFIDDLPINLRTHAHGQGYADLNPLIPEVIERFDLHKGPYAAQFGDFATAGALDVVTKDVFKEDF